MTPNDPTNSIASLGQEAELTVEQILSLTEHINTLAKSLKAKEKTTKQLVDLYGHEYATKKGLISLSESLDLRTKDFSNSLRGMQSIFQGFSTSGAISQLTKGIKGIPLVMAAAAVSIITIADSIRAELNSLTLTSTVGYGTMPGVDKNPFAVRSDLDENIFALDQSLTKAGMSDKQRKSLYMDAKATGVTKDLLPTASKELLLGVRGYEAKPEDVSNMISTFTRRFKMGGDEVAGSFKDIATTAEFLGMVNAELFTASSQLLKVFGKMNTEGFDTTKFLNVFSGVLKDQSVSLSSLIGTLNAAKESPYDVALGQAYLMEEYSPTFKGTIDRDAGIATQYSQLQGALNKDSGVYWLKHQSIAAKNFTRSIDPTATKENLTGLGAQVAKINFGATGPIIDIQNRLKMSDADWEAEGIKRSRGLEGKISKGDLDGDTEQVLGLAKGSLTAPQKLAAAVKAEVKDTVFKVDVKSIGADVLSGPLGMGNGIEGVKKLINFLQQKIGMEPEE